MPLKVSFCPGGDELTLAIPMSINTKQYFCTKTSTTRVIPNWPPYTWVQALGQLWKKFLNPVIHTSHNHNDEIAEVSLQCIFLSYHNYSERYFLQNWARILIWIIINLMKDYRHLIYKTNFPNIFHLHIFAFILCVDLITPKSLWRYKALPGTRSTKPCIEFLQCKFRHLPLRNFVCIVMYQIQIIHVVTGFKKNDALWGA